MIHITPLFELSKRQKVGLGAGAATVVGASAAPDVAAGVALKRSEALAKGADKLRGSSLRDLGKFDLKNAGAKAEAADSLDAKAKLLNKQGIELQKLSPYRAIGKFFRKGTQES